MTEERSELNRLEILKALRISNWEAVFSTVHLTLTSGAFQTGYALLLGVSNFWMGVLSSFPTFAGLIQIPSSYLVERRGVHVDTAWAAGDLVRVIPVEVANANPAPPEEDNELQARIAFTVIGEVQKDVAVVA